MALRRQWWLACREQLAMFASLRVELINRSFLHAEERVALQDLVPDESGLAPKPRAPRMTPRRRRQVANRLRATMASLPGGLVVRNAAGEIVEHGTNGH